MKVIEDRNKDGIDLFCSIIGATCRVTISNKCPNVAFISTLVVDYKYRNDGLGSALLAEVIQKIKNLGCSIASLEVEYKSWKAAWYRRLGFVSCYDCYGSDLIVMSKQL